MHIDADGNVSEVKFDNLANQESEIVQESFAFRDLKSFWESKKWSENKSFSLVNYVEEEVEWKPLSSSVYLKMYESIITISI